jgi:hypothetical protein
MIRKVQRYKVKLGSKSTQQSFPQQRSQKSLLTPVGARRKRSASARISVVALHRKYSRISNSGKCVSLTLNLGKRVSLTKSNLTKR